MVLAMGQDLPDFFAPAALPICNVSVPVPSHIPKALARALIVLMNDESTNQAATRGILVVGNLVKQQVESRIVWIKEDAIYTLG